MVNLRASRIYKAWSLDLLFIFLVWSRSHVTFWVAPDWPIKCLCLNSLLDSTAWFGPQFDRNCSGLALVSKLQTHFFSFWCTICHEILLKWTTHHCTLHFQTWTLGATQNVKWLRYHARNINGRSLVAKSYKVVVCNSLLVSAYLQVEKRTWHGHGCQTFILAEIHCYLSGLKSWHNNLFLCYVHSIQKARKRFAIVKIEKGWLKKQTSSSSFKLPCQKNHPT